MTSSPPTQGQEPALASKGEKKDPLETLTLKDGRTLAYARYGGDLLPGKVPVFYFNGTPGSRLECQLVDQPARTLGIPLISTDRPGFGKSSWQEKRTLLDWPQDVLELADHLGISKFGVIGLSGGAPYVFACLHKIPADRLVAATVVSGMYPLSLGTAGMMWQTRMMFWIAGLSKWAAEKMIDMTMGSALRGDPEKMIEQMNAQSDKLPQPQADKEVMRQILEDDVLKGAYLGSMKESLSTSSKGAAWEFSIFNGDWGFKLEELDGKRLTIWHGGLDVNVPVGMPDKASQLIPDVEFKRKDDDGHVSLIVRHREEVMSHLLAKL